MGKLITQYLETPNGGDVLLQAVPTPQQTADALALVQAVGPGQIVKSDDPRLVRLDAAELIATRLATAAGDLTVGVASDSTANDGDDWVAVWARLVAARHPALRVEHIGWDTTAQAWKAPTVIQAGAGTGPSGGTVLRDTFTRTGNVVGSASDDGKTWGGSGTTWTADGTTAGSTGVGSISRDCGGRDITITTKLRLTTTGTGATQTLRLYLGGGVFLAFSIGSTGAVTATVFKGSSTVIVPTLQLATEVGITTNSALVQDLTVTFQLAVQNLTLTLATATPTKTYTAQITEAEYASQTTVALLTSNAGAIPGIRVDEVTLAVPLSPGTGQTLRLLNGAAGGASLQYQQDRLTAMWPAATPVQVMVISTGHNYASQGETAFVAALDAFVAALRTVQPGVLLLVSSQNPQFPPAATAAAHRLRQAAARLWARRNGHAYAGALEAFTAQPNGGQALVSADGIHPTTSGTNTVVEGVGATVWAHVVDDTIRTRY